MNSRPKGPYSSIKFGREAFFTEIGKIYPRAASPARNFLPGGLPAAFSVAASRRFSVNTRPQHPEGGVRGPRPIFSIKNGFFDPFSRLITLYFTLVVMKP